MVGRGDRAGRPEPERDLFGRTPKGRDDWAHRRGEPRGFMLGWALYLMGVSGITFSGAMSGGAFSFEAYEVGASRLAVAIMIGVCVLWPATRLCQVAPRANAARSVLLDLVILIVSAQALIWPQTLMAGWPIGTAAAVTGLMVAWGLVTGAIILIGLGSGVIGRGVAIVAALLLALVPPLMNFADGGSAVRWLGPLSGVWRLTEPRAWLGEPTMRLPLGAARVVGGLIIAGLLAWAMAIAIGATRPEAVGSSGGSER